MAARSVLAGEARVEEERPAEGGLGRQADAQPAEVGADLVAVRAHQLGQRAVDRVRSLPTDGTGAPPADVLGIVELQRREHFLAAGSQRVDVLRAETERLQT